MSLAQILPDIRLLSVADKLRLMRLLALDIDVEDSVEPLEHGRSYQLSSPIFEPGASEALMRELESKAIV